jgi:hypothetical protein
MTKPYIGHPYEKMQVYSHIHCHTILVTEEMGKLDATS